MLKIAKKANHFIAVSKASKRDLIKILDIPEERISVIYEGVNHEKFYPLNKHEKFVVGYVGGLGKRKNIEVLLEAARKLENIIFKIAGKGPEKERLESIAKKLKLKNVEFVGFIPEDKLNEFYNSLELFVFPSLYEGFGLSVLEAMACGCLIISSNRGSLPEIVGKAGILINPNTNEIVIAIEKIRRDKKLQEYMRKEGIKQAKKFCWRKCAEETLKLYKTLKRRKNDKRKKRM